MEKRRKNLTDKEKLNILKDFKKGKVPLRTLGFKYKMSYASMKAFISKERLDSPNPESIPFARELRAVTKALPDFSQHLKIFCDNVMMWGDSHLPLIHEEFTEHMFDIALAFKTKTLILAGDLFDQIIFSHFPTAFTKEMLSWEEEKERAKLFFQTLKKVFDKIYIIIGNHDIRILRVLKGQETFKSLIEPLLDDKSKFIISDYPQIELNNKWIFFHPKSYSQTSMNVTRKLCNIHKKHCVTAHGHFSGLAFDVSDTYYAIDVGGILDRDKVAYIHRSITTHPKWNKGFLIVRNDCPYLFTKGADWEFWKKMLKNIK